MRFARTEDIPGLVDLAMEWGDELGKAFNKGKIFKNMYSLISNGKIFIYCVDDCPVACIAVDVGTPIFNDDKQAVERCIFVSREYRGGLVFVKLLKSVEIWAKSIGCVRIIVTSSSDGCEDINRLRNFLEKRDYAILSYEMEKEL